MTLRLTLVADGPTDQALVPLVRWLIEQHSQLPFVMAFADLRKLRRPPSKLPDRVRAALDLYPCELLVVHRDAERDPPERRIEEIERATASHSSIAVAIVPVRMTEAWLLFDESAIRRAAGCPNGTMRLPIPALKKAESLPDPKQVLHEALRIASALGGRRRKQFRPDARRLADLIDDFAPLRTLPSFSAFEARLCAALKRLRLLRG